MFCCAVGFKLLAVKKVSPKKLNNQLLQSSINLTLTKTFIISILLGAIQTPDNQIQQPTLCQRVKGFFTLTCPAKFKSINRSFNSG